METEVSDFNLHFASQFGRRVFLVAGRFYDICPDNWEKLSCIWYAKNGFLELKDDRYIGKLPGTDRDIVRYHSVDAICLSNPELTGLSLHLYDAWIGKKVELEKSRKSDPVVVILPPPPEPPIYEPKPEPKAKPIELPPKQDEPKKPRPEWRVKLGVYLSIGTPVIILLSSLLGPPWNTVAKFIFELLKTLNGG